MKYEIGSPCMMGCNIVNGGYNFAYASSYAAMHSDTAVYVCIFKRNDTEPFYELELHKTMGIVYSIFITGINIDDCFYCFKENEEYIMSLLEECLYGLYEIFDMIQSFPAQYVTRFFNKMSESAYAFELQEIYNGYKQKNPKAIDIVICPDNYKAPRIFNLPESFDTLRQIGVEKEKYDFRLDLNRKSIEYLYKELIDRYVFDISIEQFAYILTGKREKVKGDDHPSIKWLGTMQDLSCFIGLLCKKRKGKDTYGIWSITQKVFVIEGITIDNKSISTEFSKIKKDRKPYIYFKKLIEKAVD